jgi:predicted SAM-dependent methyltransferase
MKLHLGSGSRYLEGYLHIDIADYEHIDINSSVDKLNTIDNDTIDEIYASHVIEYFDRNEVESVLKEWKRVLKKDAVLRIAVPNFEALIKVYRETGEIEKILGPLYGKWGLNDSSFIYHKTVYDENSLTALLERIGFSDIKIWDWREVFKNNLEYDDHSQAYFPHMDKESGIHVSLNIQCRK